MLKKVNLIILCLVMCFGVSAVNAEDSQPAINSAAASRSLELNEKATKEANQGHLTQAENLFKQAIASDPYNLTAVYNLAGIYAVLKKESEAKKLLEDYVKRAPKDPGLHARLGDIYFSMTNVKDAEKQYDETLSLDPNYPGVYAKLATLYIMHNKIKDAEVALRIAVKEDPKNAALFRNYSAVLLANEKFDESIAAAKKALQLEGSADAYITLGSAYERSKDYKNALIAYQRAIDLGSKQEVLKEKVAELVEVTNKK